MSRSHEPETSPVPETLGLVTAHMVRVPRKEARCSVLMLICAFGWIDRARTEAIRGLGQFCNCSPPHTRVVLHIEKC
jgi:hypothetical protein